MSNDPNKPSEEQREDSEISPEDLESVSGGTKNAVQKNMMKSATKNAEAVRSLL